MAQDWRNDYTKSVVEYVKETNQFLGLEGVQNFV